MKGNVKYLNIYINTYAYICVGKIYMDKDNLGSIYWLKRLVTVKVIDIIIDRKSYESYEQYNVNVCEMQCGMLQCIAYIAYGYMDRLLDNVDSSWDAATYCLHPADLNNFNNWTNQLLGSKPPTSTVKSKKTTTRIMAVDVMWMHAGTMVPYTIQSPASFIVFGLHFSLL